MYFTRTSGWHTARARRSRRGVRRPPRGGREVVAAPRYLAFDEWPPDVYRGADVPAASSYATKPAGDRALAFSNALLVQTPEMDLSMPFNVATLQGLSLIHI